MSKLATLVRRAAELAVPRLDWVIPKSPALWAFPYTRPAYWGSNQRALYDYIREHRPDLRAVQVDLCERGRYFPLSFRAFVHLVRAQTVIIHHGPTDYRKLLATRPLGRRVVYNVWHGVNIKSIGMQIAPTSAAREELLRRARRYTGVSASSEANRRSLSVGLAVGMERVFVTGLPRNDWLLCEEAELPEHFQEQLRRLRKVLDGRRLVLYAPTFRLNSGGIPSAGFYEFSQEELAQLSRSFSEHNLVFGCRPHVNALNDPLPPGSLPLGPDVIEETQVLLREAALLVTDYSGIWVDYLLTHRPMVAFCHDREQCAEDKNLVYDMDEVFPGARVQRFDEFLRAVEQAMQPHQHPLYENAIRLFHAHRDAASCQRVVNVIQQLHALRKKRVEARPPTEHP